MGEPGQGITHPKIIDKPELKSPLRYLVEGSVTLALWAIWLYWVLPILTLFFWFIGLRFFFQTAISNVALRELAEILKDSGITILIIFVLKLAWIYYNYFAIFKRKGERRKQVSVCSDEAITKFFNII